MQIVEKYFPDLNETQLEQFHELDLLYRQWNEKINVISRKDIDQLYMRHVLHSLSLVKYISFKAGTRILDVGTGGGFPGIPLAIIFPEVEFMLVDSVGKKIRVVREISKALQLENIEAAHIRAEDLKDKYDFIVSRAVTTLPQFISWVGDKIHAKGFNDIPNGILALKGGDLEEETKSIRGVEINTISDYFDEDFFETKKIVYIPLQSRS